MVCLYALIRASYFTCVTIGGGIAQQGRTGLFIVQDPSEAAKRETGSRNPNNSCRRLLEKKPLTPLLFLNYQPTPYSPVTTTLRNKAYEGY